MEDIKSKVFLLKALLYPLIFTLAMFLTWSMLVTYGNVKLNTGPTVVNVTSAIGVFMSAFLCTKAKRNRGFVTGIAGAMIYVIIIFLLSLAFNGGLKYSFSSGNILRIIAALCIGILAGVIGVNTGYKAKKKRKR